MVEAHEEDEVWRNYSLWFLLINSFIGQVENLCFGVMIIVFIADTNLINSVYPISIFLYAALDYPKSSKFYWNMILGYTVICIGLRCFI